MRQVLTLLLIAMLACVGPVSGAVAHAHGVDADHHHLAHSPDIHDDVHTHRGTDREIELRQFSADADADTEAPDTGNVVLHAHIHMDGAPIATIEGHGLPQRVGMVRVLTNSAPVPDPGSAGPQRPPRTIL